MLATADDKATVLEGSTMGTGYDDVSLPIPRVAFPKIFKKPSQRDIDLTSFSSLYFPEETSLAKAGGMHVCVL